ncbi:nitroreductase [Mycobacterium asiaticum]|uniref:nitroreductase family protein n=1 Tax=Mycobacterium asiaticum TaxID=1790 RepID=UPI0007EF7C23|nr:nitroreductase family protein [Mycobacterium asiaticum]OBK92645.1 nitroreductase [Mycobacterium asiaticum]
MSCDLSVDQALTTTRAVRRRLDLRRPVPRQILMECLDLALQAPTGANSQGWQWVFVDDVDKRYSLAEIYRSVADPYIDALGESPHGDASDKRISANIRSGKYLSKHLHEVPVLLVPCLAGRPENVDHIPGGTAAFWGSLLPAVWSFMLALRSRGLGSAWTTFHLSGDGEKRAAEILEIPYESYSQGGLIPIAYTIGTGFRRAERIPAAHLTHWNTW